MARLRTRIAFAGVLLALASGLAACGGTSSSSAGTGTGSTSLTVYSSLPLQGPSRVAAESIVNAEKLALEEVGGRVGGFTVKFAALDDSQAGTGRWEPGIVMTNARRAVRDRTTIAYLGEMDSGASAIAIPVLNTAGVLTVSPSSTYPGLTKRDGADKGEPEKYYPSGSRTFGRVVPTDEHQARAQAALQKADGCRRLYVLDDRDVYGHGIAGLVAREATEAGIEVVGSASVDAAAKSYADTAADVAESGADCAFYGGTVEDQATTLWDDLHRALPRLELYGPDALVDAAFAASLTPGAAARTHLTTYAADPADYTGAARAFARRYQARFKSDPTPDAIYGYVAMRLVLQAIRDAGSKGNDRQAVIDAFFALGKQDTVVGELAVDAHGDVQGEYHAVEVRGGRLRAGRALPER